MALRRQLKVPLADFGINLIQLNVLQFLIRIKTLVIDVTGFALFLRCAMLTMAFVKILRRIKHTD